jgi:hypothetical protein
VVKGMRPPGAHQQNAESWLSLHIVCCTRLTRSIHATLSDYLREHSKCAKIPAATVPLPRAWVRSIWKHVNWPKNKTHSKTWRHDAPSKQSGARMRAVCSWSRLPVNALSRLVEAGPLDRRGSWNSQHAETRIRCAIALIRGHADLSDRNRSGGNSFMPLRLCR